ncbi:MAG: hypothetical protein MO852_09680, partial [Candidatus Devosia euplotis]|nr:hypothetical protein [Candidatus Devosia euplotis]
MYVYADHHDKPQARVANILGFRDKSVALKSTANFGRKIGEIQGIFATPEGGFAAWQSESRHSAFH